MKMMNTQYCSSPVTNGADLILESSMAFIITPIIDNVPPLLRQTNIRMTCVFISFTFFLLTIRKLMDHLYSSIRLLLDFQSLMNFIGYKKTDVPLTENMRVCREKCQCRAYSLIKFKWLIKTSKKECQRMTLILCDQIVHLIECMCIMHACSLSNSQFSINQFTTRGLIQLHVYSEQKKISCRYPLCFSFPPFENA